MRVTFDENELYFPDDMDEDELKSLIGSYREQQRIARVNNPNYGDSVTKAGMASPTTPSLADNIQLGIGNALHDSGIISDRAGAMNVGKNLGMGAEFQPQIGTAVAIDDVVRAVKSGNPLDIALAGVGAIPVVGELASAVVPAFMRKRQGTDYSIVDIADSMKEGDKLEYDLNMVSPSEAKALKVEDGYVPSDENVVTAYKLFKKKKDGGLYPLYINANDRVEQGVWLDAQMGELKDVTSTSKKTGETKTVTKVKSKIGMLAPRPGWHAGEAPSTRHIGGKAVKDSAKAQYRLADQVWAKVEMPNDVDWQTEALNRGTFTQDGKLDEKTIDIRDELPYGGFYKFKTNADMDGEWLISGQQRVGEELSRAQGAEINAAMGVPDLPLLPDFLDQNPDLKISDLTGVAVRELKKNYPDYYNARFGAGADNWNPPALSVDEQLASTIGSESSMPKSDIDQVVADIPTITKDMANELFKGKTIKPTLADLMDYGREYRGIDSSVTEGTELQGGVGFPTLSSFNEDGIVWAANKPSQITKLQGSDYIVVSALGSKAHMSNATYSKSFLDTVDAYVRDNRIPLDNALQLDEMIAKQPGMGDFPGLENPAEYEKWAADMTFEQRKSLMNVMSSKAAQKIGAPNMDRVRNEMIDKDYAGSNLGDGMIVIKVDQGDDAMVELGTNGTKKHGSYKYGVKGEIVGKFARPVSMKELFPDQNVMRVMGGGDNSADFRSFQLRLPTQTVNDDVINAIPDAPIDNIDSPRQAQIADDFLNNAWSSTNDAVNAGGVSPGQFIDEVKANPMQSMLETFDTEEKAKEMTDKVKDGKLTLFKLGNNKVFFGLEKDYDYGAAFDGFDASAAGLGANEVALTSVLSNEVGAPNIAGASVMMKAIEEGATVLDAFKVKSSKYPDGYLPRMYQGYGFEEVGTVPFDESQYTDIQLKDIKQTFKQQGWQDGDPMPELSIMKFTGDDNDRANYASRWLDESGAGGQSSGNTGAIERNGATADTANGEKYSAATEQLQAGDSRDAAGGLRGGSELSNAQKSARTIQAVKNLSDSERRSLGLRSRSEIQFDNTQTAAQAQDANARTQSISNTGGVRGKSWVLEEQTGKKGTKTLYNRVADGGIEDLPRDIQGFDVKPNLRAGETARNYMASVGQGGSYQPINKYMPPDERRGTEIAQAFDEMEHNPNDPKVKAAYSALIDETLSQYDEMLKDGFVAEFIEPTMEYPYANPRGAIDDIDQNNHMWVDSTREEFGSDDSFDVSDNPLLQETNYMINGKKALANDIFRIVHDYYGHAKEGLGFRAGGEDNAFRSHASMYSPLARKALATETRGQNSFVNYGKNAQHNKTADTSSTIYADQKIGLLPDWIIESFGDADIGLTPAKLRAKYKAKKLNYVIK